MNSNNSNNSNSSLEEEVVATPLNVAMPKKEKRVMSAKERERNERRKAAFAEIRGLNPKAKWTNASKLVSYRNKGKSANANALLRNIRNSVNAAGIAAKISATVANKPVAPAVKKAKKEVAFAAVKAANNAVTRNNQNRSREAVKANLTSRMSVHGKSPSAILIQKLLGLRRAGKNNSEFLAEVDKLAAAAAAKNAAVVVRREERIAKKAERNTAKALKRAGINQRKANRTAKATAKATPKVPNATPAAIWKNLKMQVNRNVESTGQKLNAINRRALAHLRKNNPNITVTNFMKNRVPHKRRSKKNRNGIQMLPYKVQKQPKAYSFKAPSRVNRNKNLEEQLREYRAPQENIGNFAPPSNKYEQERLNSLLSNIN